MGECKLDHSRQDVLNKLESQLDYLPEALSKDLMLFLKGELSQHTLNELFHLLKKYDLAPEADREERNGKLRQLISESDRLF
ncbi:hypothetical protein [Ferviditalea candida]|uniref:Group-specific protein n=1 Tax=Ferviditalea candida TaxID=3108399 RepID=A0ABU5ZC54_9BACL|nr:hypothetical protein [Paenibacillaceae bacterium T2]